MTFVPHSWQKEGLELNWAKDALQFMHWFEAVSALPDVWPLLRNMKLTYGRVRFDKRLRKRLLYILSMWRAVFHQLESVSLEIYKGVRSGIFGMFFAKWLS